VTDPRYRAVVERRRSNAAGPHPLKPDKGSRAEQVRAAILADLAASNQAAGMLSLTTMPGVEDEGDTPTTQP
jgi:hypothetical protein